MRKATMNEAELDDVVERIHAGKLKFDNFIGEVKACEDVSELLIMVRRRLMEVPRSWERSIYCRIIRDLEDREALPLLWELLVRDDTKGSRGSIVCAMETMNPIEFFENLVDLSISDGFEVNVRIQKTVDQINGVIDAKTFKRCISKIREALRGEMPEWRRHTLDVLLEILLSAEDIDD